MDKFNDRGKGDQIFTVRMSKAYGYCYSHENKFSFEKVEVIK